MCFELSPWITGVSLSLAVASFLLYCVQVYLTASNTDSRDVAVKAMRKIVSGEGGGKSLGEDISKPLEALSTLVDSIVKGGPAMVGIVASIVFLLLAIVNESGYLRSPVAFAGADSKAAAAANPAADAPKAAKPQAPGEPAIVGSKQETSKPSRP